MEIQIKGLKEIRKLIEEYLKSGKGSPAVQEFLTKIEYDDAFLHRFLKGRKNRPKHAWETIKNYAEVRFDSYPELFPPIFPRKTLPLIDNCIFGVLKNRDSKGRLILYFNGNEWDTEKCNMELLTITGVFIAERIMLNNDGLNNGIIYIKECLTMGTNHARQYTLVNMLRLINVFWHAFPLKIKEVYMLNLPYTLSVPYGIIKPFFPKKLTERIVLTSTGKKFDALHERISPSILPKCLGGSLENHEACDRKIFKLQ